MYSLKQYSGVRLRPDAEVAQWAAYFIAGMTQQEIGICHGLNPQRAASAVCEQLALFLRKWNPAAPSLRRYVNVAHRKRDHRVAVRNWRKSVSGKAQPHVSAGP
jgi:hypothetical protein